MKNDYLFDDMFDNTSKFGREIKTNQNNKKITGNVRLAQGMYRTDEEKENYRKKSLERDLP